MLNLAAGDMECGEYHFCFTELESPVVEVGGHDGHVCCQTAPYGLQVLFSDLFSCLL